MYSKGDTVWAFLYSLFVVFNTYVIAISANNSNALVIERSTIRSVNFNNAKPGITRSYFEVFFEDEDSKIKKLL
jgi:hypothetical protein